MLEVNFELTFDDFIKCGQDIYTIPRFRNPHLIVFILSSILLFFGFLDATAYNYTVIATIFLSAVIFIYMVRGLVMYYVFKTSTPKRTIKVSERGISILTGDTTTVHSWSAIREIYNTKNTIFAFVTPQIPVIIPKNSFETLEDALKYYDYMEKCYSLAKTTSNMSF